MDADRARRRVWVLPLIFALTGLSLPIQMYVKDRVGEPYPGLFQPSFANFPDVGNAIKYRVIDLDVDGRTVDAEKLFPGSNTGKRRKLLESMFPPNGDKARVDTETRARLRSRLSDAHGAKARTLTATWQRRRFDLDSRETSVVKTLSRYQIDLTGGGG
jgi:hypothetical protein